MNTPGTFEEVVDYSFWNHEEGGYIPKPLKMGMTALEKVYGKGQSNLRPDHIGSSYNHDNYQHEEAEEFLVTPSDV